MSEESTTEFKIAPQRSAEYDAAVHYDASPKLEAAFESILNDAGVLHVAQNGLRLSSRVMRFPSLTELQQFQGNVIDRTLRNSDSHLQRVDIRSTVEWESATRQDGVEFNRIYLQPVPVSAIALRSLYGQYLRSYPPDKPYDTQDPHQRLQSGSLSYILPSSHLKVSGQDGANVLSDELRNASASGRQTVYGFNPHPANHRVRP